MKPRFVVRAVYIGPPCNGWTHVDGFAADTREAAQAKADEWNAAPGNEDSPYYVVERCPGCGAALGGTYGPVCMNCDV